MVDMKDKCKGVLRSV